MILRSGPQATALACLGFLSQEKKAICHLVLLTCCQGTCSSDGLFPLAPPTCCPPAPAYSRLSITSSMSDPCHFTICSFLDKVDTDSPRSFRVWETVSSYPLAPFQGSYLPWGWRESSCVPQPVRRHTEARRAFHHQCVKIGDELPLHGGSRHPPSPD